MYTWNRLMVIGTTLQYFKFKCRNADDRSWDGNSHESRVGMQYETESEGHLPFL